MVCKNKIGGRNVSPVMAMDSFMDVSKPYYRFEKNRMEKSQTLKSKSD